MDSLRQRIRELLKSKDMNVNRLAIVMSGFSQSKLNNQINGTSMVTADTLCGILSMYPDVSADWLLLGIGGISRTCGATMSASIGTMSNGSVNVGNGTYITSNSNETEMLKKRIAELESDKQILKNNVELLQRCLSLNDHSL